MKRENKFIPKSNMNVDVAEKYQSPGRTQDRKSGKKELTAVQRMKVEARKNTPTEKDAKEIARLNRELLEQQNEVGGPSDLKVSGVTLENLAEEAVNNPEMPKKGNKDQKDLAYTKDAGPSLEEISNVPEKIEEQETIMRMYSPSRVRVSKPEALDAHGLVQMKEFEEKETEITEKDMESAEKVRKLDEIIRQATERHLPEIEIHKIIEENKTKLGISDADFERTYKVYKKELSEKTEYKKLSPWKKVGKFAHSFFYGAKTLGISSTFVLGLLFGHNKAQAGEVSNKPIDPENAKQKRVMVAPQTQEDHRMEDAYIVSQKDLEGGGDGDNDQEKLKEQQKIQDEKDSKIHDKWAEIFSQDKSKYATGEEAESLIRYSLKHVRDMAPDEESLTRLLRNTYGGNINMTGEEFKDFYSFIHHGHPDGKDLDKEGVGQLQEIINKLSNACIDQAQRPEDEATLKEAGEKNALMTEMLKSNAGKEFNQGKDKLAGVETTINTLQTLTLADLELIKQVPLGATELEQRAHEGITEKKFGPIPEELGQTTVGIEIEVGGKDDRIIQFDPIFERFGKFDSSSIEELIKTAKGIDSRNFNKIERTTGGETEVMDFDESTDTMVAKNDSGDGHYNLKNVGGRFSGSLDYTLRDTDAHKKIENIVIEDNQSGAKISIGNIEKNMTHAGQFTFQMNNVRFEFPTVEGQEKSDFISFDGIKKFETNNEIGGVIENFSGEIGGIQFKFTNLSADIMKGENGEWDLGQLMKDVVHGAKEANGETIKPGDLFNRFGGHVGEFVIDNPEGNVHIKYDGDYLYFNNHQISRDNDGNFRVLNMETKDGLMYKGGFSSYAVVNGQNMTGGQFIDKLVYEGAKIMEGSPDVEVGFSALGGAVTFKTEIASNIDAQELDSWGKDVDKLAQETADTAKELWQELKEGSKFKDIIDKGLDAKVKIIDKYTTLADRVINEGQIDINKREFVLDFPKFSENLELIGDQGPANSEYGVYMLGKVLRNDLGRVVIDDDFIKEYKEVKKAGGEVGDVICKKLWGSSMQELKDDFVKRAAREFGEDIFEQDAENILRTINAINRGSTEVVTLTQTENGETTLSGFASFTQKVSKLENRKVHIIGTAYVDIGDGNREETGFIKAIGNTEGKEHAGASYEADSKAGASIIFTKLVANSPEKGFKATAIGEIGATYFTGKINASINDGIGNTIEGPSVENILKFADGVGIGDYDKQIDFLKELRTSGKVLPHVSLGLNLHKDFNTKLLGEFETEANFLMAGIPLPKYPAVRYSFEGLVQKVINTNFAPIIVGAKVNFSMHNDGNFIQDASGKVFASIPLSGWNKHYK